MDYMRLSYIYMSGKPYLNMRVGQKARERGFLCVGLWVCNK